MATLLSANCSKCRNGGVFGNGSGVRAGVRASSSDALRAIHMGARQPWDVEAGSRQKGRSAERATPAGVRFDSISRCALHAGHEENARSTRSQPTKHLQQAPASAFAAMLLGASRARDYAARG